jgi:hypothetical protein
MLSRLRIRFALSVAIASLAGACGGGSGSKPADAGEVDASEDGAPVPGVGTDGGFSLRPAPSVDPNALQNGTLVLSASGEALALQGYNFPAQNPGDGVFADGWEVRFSHFIATFDKVSLWKEPDRSPADQSQVGALVAELDGPWAVDLHTNGPGWPYIDGKEQGERAVVFAVLPNQNKLSGSPAFPTDGTRLAIGFSAVVATPSALNVNLDADALAEYAAMVDNHCTVLYVGQATWKGDQATGVCVTPSDAGTAGGKGGVGGEAEFGLLPRTVNFDLCYKPADSAGLQPGDPETSWINCDNADNDPAPPLDAEPHQRGVAFFANKYTVGEVTFHTDHPFWESTQHDTPARFDPFAAQLAGAPADGGIPTVHLSDVIGVDYTWFTDKLGNLLPWRTCDPNYLPPSGIIRVGPMNFNPVSVPHCVGGDHSTGLCDYYDFSKYNQSTQGHWNGADGLCFVTRHYPSPL